MVKSAVVKKIDPLSIAFYLLDLRSQRSFPQGILNFFFNLDVLMLIKYVFVWFLAERALKTHSADLEVSSHTVCFHSAQCGR